MPTKFHIVKAMVFPADLYRCESWTKRKAKYQRIDAFELWCWRRLLNWKEVKPVNPKGNQSWIFIGMTDAEGEAPILWLPDEKSQVTGKDLDVTEDLSLWGKGGNRGWDGWMASQTQLTWVWVNSGNGDGQGGLACCSPWSPKELDTTKQLNNNNNWITDESVWLFKSMNGSWSIEIYKG